MDVPQLFIHSPIEAYFFDASSIWQLNKGAINIYRQVFIVNMAFK